MLHRYFNGVCDYKHEDTLVRLNFLTLHLRRGILMTFSFLMFLKAKLVAHLFLIQLVCAYPLGLSETTLLLMYIAISRSVPQPDMCLLPMQAVGASTSLTKIVFCLLISVSFLNKDNCSIFLYHHFVFNCIYFVSFCF
jgi:hypothetical protein